MPHQNPPSDHLLDDEDLLFDSSEQLGTPGGEPSKATPSLSLLSDEEVESEAADGSALEADEEEGERIVMLSEVSMATLYALRRLHVSWCAGAGFALVLGFLIPSESALLSLVRFLVMFLASLVGLSRVWYLNGVQQEIQKREANQEEGWDTWGQRPDLIEDVE